MGARLFAALVPPAEVVAALDEFREPRVEADRTLRWTHPESWHLTTVFMESVPEKSHDRLVENLAEVARRTPPLDVRLAGAGCFPDPIRAKVLYLAAHPAGELGRLAERCRSAASAAGAGPDGSRFVPHLTVARMRRPIEATRWLRIFDAAPEQSWRAGELCLIESHLRDRGSRYEVVERFGLAGPRD